MVKIARRIVPTYTSGGKLYARGKHRNTYIGSAGTNRKKYIAVHQTGNTSRGANADMHGKLQMNGNTRIAGWPYSVDDSHAVQSFEHDAIVFHAGDYKGNREAIGVEICVNQDGDYLKALQNGAALVKHIMKVEGIPLSNVVQHNYYSGKNCPSHLRRAYKGVSWLDFKNMVQGAPSVSKPVVKVEGTTSAPTSPSTSSGAKLIKNETAYFLVTTPNGIKVRDKPSVKATHTGTLKQGDSINYFKVYEGGGYRWLEYTGYSGKKLYVPYRESGTGKTQWGTFHSARPGSKAVKTTDQMAREVIAGQHGNGHAQRQKSLGISNAEYQKVRARVNRLA